MSKLQLSHIKHYLDHEVMAWDRGEIIKFMPYHLGMHLKQIKRGDDFKLILRPLSDLTKEIEVNGEKFIPIIELAKMFHIDGKYEVTHYTIKEQFGSTYRVRCNVENDDSRYLCYAVPLAIDECEYRVMQKLFKWHFDTDRLIKKGLAIDINTLNKTDE